MIEDSLARLQKIVRGKAIVSLDKLFNCLPRFSHLSPSNLTNTHCGASNQE